MKRTLTIMASLAVAFIASTAAADTHLWLTTEGAGIEVSSSGHRPPPPPPHRMHYHHHGVKHCKVCKKHNKEMKKLAKKHHKEMKKMHKKHNRHHHR